MTILERYAYYWQPEPNTGCFLWFGYLRGGRGSYRPCVQYEGKPTHLTRLICEEVYGPPPSSMHQAAHKPPCNNHICVNPDHLYWATPSQNALDMVRMADEYRYRSGANIAAGKRSTDNRI